MTFKRAMAGSFAVVIIMMLSSARSNVKHVKQNSYASSVYHKPITSASTSSMLGTGSHYQQQLMTPQTSSLIGSSTSLTGNLRGNYDPYSSGQGTMGRSTLSSTFSTATLLDTHGDSVRVLPGDFRDFGGSTDFHGQVETLQAYEGCGVVDKVLQSPGNGKVLVVDGGGNLNSAVLDENGVKQAQRNGWKGIVVVGAIRGSKSIGSLPVGVKALGASPRKGGGTTGNKGSALSVSGVQIVPGHWIYCDKDGIVLSDRELPTTASASYNTLSTESSLSTGQFNGNSVGGYGSSGITGGAARNYPGLTDGTSSLAAGIGTSAYGGASSTLSTGLGGSSSTLSTGLGGSSSSLSTGLGGSSSLYANRAIPTKTSIGLPNPNGATSPFNSFARRRGPYSQRSKGNTTSYVVVAVCIFWIVIVLRYVGRD